MFFLKKKKTTQPLSENMLEVKEALKRMEQSVSLSEELSLSKQDQQLLQYIRRQTYQLNRDNVTRTKAYLDFYCLYPEVHWAFLGHMVSRNGGWNMTDLRGDFFSRILNEEKRQVFFTFLERGNWLIFQDAYPQFLLFAESERQKRNLFYLLPYLNISLFMEVIWNQYWRKRDRYLLAIALIINEQSYLEQRIIQNSLFKEKVFHTLEFVLQDVLSVNHILFPYEGERESEGKASLVGLTLHHFGSLHERIMLGKRLYRLLFQDENQLKKVFRWAVDHPHTGSRKDYWKDVFNDVDEGVPGTRFTRRLKGCQLRNGAIRLYSPRLEYAWKNVEHPEAELGDWFHHWNVIDYLQDENESIHGEIIDEYCETIEKLELAALAKKAIFH
ncbi:DUF2515 family protein [Bacillus sp. B190/17]|uniref:DUF2515 family protein n=1 Tax=Bacillus lumedeiriae TaxID=3058829 RepID=A0ABW8IAC4_9BACI